MTFNINNLYSLEKNFETVLKVMLGSLGYTSLSDLNMESLREANKDVLAHSILNLVDAMRGSGSVMRSAAVNIEQLRNNQIFYQNTIIKPQKPTIQRHDHQMKEVQFVVKTDLVHAKSLKHSAKIKKVLVSPDRSLTARVDRRKMKKIEEEPRRPLK